MLRSLFSAASLPSCLFDPQGAFTLGVCKILGLGLDAWTSVIGLSVLGVLGFLFVPIRATANYVFAAYQRWRSLGRIRPASGTRISVLLIRLQGDDEEQSARESILEVVRGELREAIEIIKWPLLAPTREGHEADTEQLVFGKIQEWLRATSCDVAIWGRVKDSDLLSLSFTIREFGSRLPETYKLTDKLELPREFIQTLGLTIAMRVCAPEWSVQPRTDLIEYLTASARRLKLIIESGAFNEGVRAALISTYGRALLTVGQQRNSSEDNQRAVDAYKIALTTFTPDRTPEISKALSIALATSLCILADRENSSLFSDAEGVYRAVLDRIDPDTDLMKWGAVACNLGNTLSRMGERQSGPEKLREAISVLQRAAERCTREVARLTNCLSILL